MPEWLFNNEEYNPPVDHDTFINKSIMSILRILSRIRYQNEYSPNYSKVNATLKVAFTLMIIILISLTRNFTFVIITNVYMLVLLSFMSGNDIIRVLKVSLPMTLFTFITLLPALFMGNTYSSIMITTKVLATITAVNILSRTTRWHRITSSLKRFFVPNLFIFVLDITIKYIVMLGDLALNLLYALKLKSIGRNKRKYSSLSGIAGTMFIKSKEMAEEMYSAMECRGFSGNYYINNTFKLRVADYIYIIMNLFILVIFMYLGRN